MARGSGEIPRNLNHDRMKALLEANGWTESRGGKHVTKMRKAGERPITLPRHKNQTYGTDLRARLLREAGLQGSQGRADGTDVDDASGE